LSDNGGYNLIKRKRLAQIRIIEAVIASAIIIGSLGTYSVFLIPSVKLESQSLEQTAISSITTIAGDGSLARILNTTQGDVREAAIRNILSSSYPRGYLFSATFLNITDAGSTPMVMFNVNNTFRANHQVTIVYDFMTTRQDFSDPDEEDVFKVIQQIRIILGLSEAG